jgi:hypothetical protein
VDKGKSSVLGKGRSWEVLALHKVAASTVAEASCEPCVSKDGGGTVFWWLWDVGRRNDVKGSYPAGTFEGTKKPFR